MTDPTLHVVFTESGAKELRRALATLGLNDEVITQRDTFSFGPINPPDIEVRIQWEKTVFGEAELVEVADQDRAFWAQALSERRDRIVWVSRRSAHEYSGFLSFVDQLGAGACDIIDLTQVRRGGLQAIAGSTTSDLLGSLGATDAALIVEDGLLGLRREFPEPERAPYRAAWSRLRQEDAPLRIVSPELELVSAPITFFDDALFSNTSDRWLKAARVIGQTMAGDWDDCRFQCGDTLLSVRLRALVEAGRLEGQGDLSRIQHSEVRRLQPER
jgi:hypothetical protein